MELSHREILKQLRKNIIEDIDVHNGIINVLLEKKILNNNDIEQINTAESKSAKAEALLDILPNRGSRAYQYFGESLRLHYPWLRERMAEMEQTGDQYISKMEYRESVVETFSSHTPTLVVPRREKTEKLKGALTKLASNAYVCLHGMKGFGKSSLARSVIYDDKEFVKKDFGNEVYWLKFGRKGTDDSTIESELALQLNHLHHMVTNKIIQLSSKPSNEMIQGLKQHFLQKDHRKALIILDDVWDKRIIELFDFECKTLVITTDRTLMGIRHAIEFIPMVDGFTEAESLELFAKALGIEIEELPEEARKIHDVCDGMPLLIAMFAAQFEEFKKDMAISPDRWQYYLKALRKKDTTNHVMEKFLTTQQTIFDMCIDQLPSEEQKLYKMLVIFDEDVNIAPATLEVLWGIEKFRVEDIMLGLCHKSLAVKQWNPDLKLYIYGIHDLLVCHMRNKIIHAELVKQHRNFVNNIFRYCKNDYSKLPMDNYCYSYIGHHLAKAEMFCELRTIYLDFKFLQAKINSSGVNDLLIDLIAYRKYITNDNQEIENKLKNLTNLIESYARILADHRHRKCVDLVQVALNHHEPGFCYDAARAFARIYPEYFYFSHTREHHYSESPPSTEMPSELNTINFTDDPEQVLIGSKNGQVLQTRGKCWRPFDFHDKSAIIKVIVSLGGDFFLALNEKSTIKRFLLKSKDEYENPSGNSESETTTPREKQKFWNNVHRERNDTSVTTYCIENQQITDMALSSDDKRVAACSKKGLIVVWDVNGEIISTLKSSNNGIQRIIFTKVRKYIHALDTKGQLIIFEENCDQYANPSQFHPLWKDRRNLETDSEDIEIIFFQEIPSRDSYTDICTVIVTTDKAFEYELVILQSGTLCNPDRRNLFEAEKCKFITATITHDDKYLITAGTDDIVKVWDIIAPFGSIQSYTARAKSLDTYFDDDKHIIISGYKRSIQRFTFCRSDNLPRSIKRPLFDTAMKPRGDLDIVAREVVGNKIGLHRGYEMIAEFQCQSQIVTLSLNTDGTKILYATNKGAVYLYDVNDRKATLIMRVNECSSFVRFLGIGNTIVCKDKEELIFWCDGHQSMTRAKNIIDVHNIVNNYVIMISREETIIIWQKVDNDWQPMGPRIPTNTNDKNIMGTITIRNSNICYSSLNTTKNMLALLNVTYELILYKIIYDENAVPIKTEEYGKKRYFGKKLECCAFSSDGKLIAIGMHDGDIFIYDIYEERKCGELKLHCNSVRQLHWAPAAIGIPILFSVNCDELAAWNINLIPDEKKKIRRSRTGMPRSATTSFGNSSSSLNLPISSSQSASADLVSLTPRSEDNQNGRIGMSSLNRSIKFWSSKIAKDPDFPALLGLISLPLSCNAKLSVSPDCNKFLSVDVYGLINNFTFFDSSEESDDN